MRPIPIARKEPALGDNPDFSYAIYPDPPSHDFLTWLVKAELMRRYHGATAPLKVRFFLRNGMLGTVDYGRYSILRGDAWQCGVTPQYSDEMLANVLRPAIAMMGAVNEPDLHFEDAHSRKELGRYCEYNYFLGELVDAARAGFELPQFVAPKWAHNEVAEFLAGRVPVVITLRECERQNERNSNVAEWVHFAGWARLKDYFVLFVRDTVKAHEPIIGFPTYPRASRNAYVRLALYQQSLCNLAASNGPNEWCIFGGAPFLLFRQLGVSRSDWGHGTADAWKRQEHMDVGEQYPWATPRQRLAWADDTFEEIRVAFERFVSAA